MGFFIDLHIHIGRTSEGHPVKVSASSDLTFEKILEESANRKGLDAVGIVDCASPGVHEDMRRLIASGDMTPMADGGLSFRERLVVYPAAEIGVAVNGKEAHFISFLPTLDAAVSFSNSIAPHITNVQLSSQKARMSLSELCSITVDCGGFLVPAHVFTPHKGYFGHAATRLDEGFDASDRAGLVAVELGLSADSEMASRLSDLDGVAFVTNSDAHSAAKIAREYNQIEAPDLSFKGLLSALKGENGRIVANYGLDPRLGKYHKTRCDRCTQEIPLNKERTCPACGSNRITVGVSDRLEEVADRAQGALEGRPPYVHQVPLEFVPGVGRRTLNALLEAFGTEMNVLHRASEKELAAVVGEKVAQRIVMARTGHLRIVSGGGGKYGRIEA